jgi:hypothetical protein
MHTILAVAASQARCLDMPPDSHRTKLESHHTSQCITLFNQRLSYPIIPSDQDALWATAALMSIMSICSFDSNTPEEAWPLRQPDPSDLEWLRLAEGKHIIWNLTQPLRPGGIFRAMAHVYANLYYPIPVAGVEGIPPVLTQLCGLTSSSHMENNPYFSVTHVLTQIQAIPEVKLSGTAILGFVGQAQPSYKSLLQEKDPVALLLMGLWYKKIARVVWWFERRARIEGEAIRLYLKQFHDDDPKLRPARSLL